MHSIKAERPDDKVTYRDLAAARMAHLNGSHLMAASPIRKASMPLVSELNTGRGSLDEFLAADIVVIGAPMYNFAIPSQLKTWIDRILVAGTTFRYTESGLEGWPRARR